MELCAYVLEFWMVVYIPTLLVFCQPHGSEFSFALADSDYNSHNINLI